jgi:thioredoxin 1
MDKKKKLIIEIIIFILALLAITFGYNYLINQLTEEDGKDISKNINDENIEIMEIKNTEEFEKEVINSNQTVFIDFYATWCKPCKIMTPIIEEIAKEYKEIKFVKMDIDKNEELAIKYNIMSIPTMMIIKNGEVKKTFIGITDKQSITKEF